MECENCKEILNERQMYINACEQIKALQNLLQKRNEMLKEKDNILENYDLDRLKELMQADKEGRCAVLPCKVGNVLYTNIATPDMKRKDRPYPIKVCYIGLNEKSGYFNVVYKNDSMWQFSFEQIGKYVFLTYEEAEQELKREKE